MQEQQDTVDTLNRLLAIHYRSLPMYLIWATPYRRAGDEAAWQVANQVAQDQRQFSAQIVELIESRRERVDYGDFPITFTGSHDLALKFLVRRLIEWQKDTVVAIRECCDALADDPIAQGLADECLGAAKGHLESLEELLSGNHRPLAVKIHEPEAAGH